MARPVPIRPVTVRSVASPDFVPIAALTNQFIEKTAIHFGYEPVTPDELETLHTKYAGKYPYLIAEIEGRFAGYAKAGVWRDRAAYQWTTEVGIYVEPALHRSGVGRALYGRLIAELRAAGFHSAVGGITLPNEASVRLHEAMGFVKVAHFAHAGYKFNMWHDVGFWQLMLA